MRLPALLVAALFVVIGQIHAQNSLARVTQDKQRVFAHLPQKMNVSDQALESIFSHNITETITIRFHPEFELKATVIDKVFRNGGAVSMNLKAQNYQGIVYNFSRYLIAGKKVHYYGRAIHPGFADVMVLKQTGQQYYFEVSDAKKLIAE